MLIEFPKDRVRGHRRTSVKPADSAFRSPAARSANTSRVISLRPRATASLTTAPQCAAGMAPRDRQLLTVESDRESAAATCPVPPRSSMIELIDCMDATIVRNLRTRQGSATCEQTFFPDHAQILGMKPLRDAPDIVGKRLAETRVALGYESQVEFAATLGLGKSTYNPYEKGSRPLTLQTALKIQAQFHIPINWLLNGDPSQLPHHVHKLLVRAA